MKITHSYCNECLADKKQKVFFLPPSLSLSPPLTEKYFGTFASIFFFSFYFTKLRPVLLQEGGPLPGPESGLLSNTQKWIVWGDTHIDKARGFIGKGSPGGDQQGKGTQENCSATWFAVSGFMVIGLASGFSLANHSDSGSFLVACTSLSQDGIQRGGFWEVGRTYGLVSPLSFWPFLNYSGWWWLVSSTFLTRTSYCKMIHADGYYRIWPGRQF